jgi:hypothetical protein
VAHQLVAIKAQARCIFLHRNDTRGYFQIACGDLRDVIALVGASAACRRSCDKKANS